MLISKNFGRSQTTNPKKHQKKVRFLDEHMSKKVGRAKLRKSGTKFFSKNPIVSRHRQMNLKKSFVIKRRSGSTRTLPSPNSPLGSFSSVTRLVKHQSRDSGGMGQVAGAVPGKKSKFSPDLESQPRPFEEYADRAIMMSQEMSKVRTPKIRGKGSQPSKTDFNRRSLQTPSVLSSYGGSTARNREIYERLVTMEKENRRRNGNGNGEVFLKKGSVQLEKIKSILKNKEEQRDAFNYYSATTSIADKDSAKLDSPRDYKNGGTVFFRIKDNPLRKNILHNFQDKGKKDLMDESEFERANRHSMEFVLTSLKDLLTKAVELNKRDIRESGGGKNRLSSIFSDSVLQRNSQNKAILYVRGNSINKLTRN